MIHALLSLSLEVVGTTHKAMEEAAVEVVTMHKEVVEEVQSRKAIRSCDLLKAMIHYPPFCKHKVGSC